MPRQIRVTLVVLVSLVSGLSLAVAVSAVELASGFPLFGFSLLFIIPVGAVSCGFVAAGGFFAASRLLHVRPDGGMFVVPLATASVTFLVSHWLTFSRYEFAAGRTYADAMTFAHYLRAVSTESGLSFGANASIDRLGSLGYLVVAIEIIGSGAGGWLALTALRARPWCGASGRFMRKVDHRRQQFDAEGRFHLTMAQVYQLADEGRLAAMVRVLPERERRTRHGRFALDVGRYHCPACGQEHVIVTSYERRRNAWHQTSDNTFHSPPAGDLLVAGSLG